MLGASMSRANILGHRKHAYLNASESGKHESLKLMTEMLKILLAQYLLYYELHWKSAGPSQYGDHQLFSRLYTAVQGELDALAEKIVGYHGGEGLEMLPLVAGAHRYLSKWLHSTDGHIEQGLMAERELQNYFHECYDLLKAKDLLPMGLDDWIMATTNSHESHSYLLQQRAGSEKTAASEHRMKMRRERKKLDAAWDRVSKTWEEDWDKPDSKRVHKADKDLARASEAYAYNIGKRGRRESAAKAALFTGGLGGAMALPFTGLNRRAGAAAALGAAAGGIVASKNLKNNAKMHEARLKEKKAMATDAEKLATLKKYLIGGAVGAAGGAAAGGAAGWRRSGVRVQRRRGRAHVRPHQ